MKYSYSSSIKKSSRNNLLHLVDKKLLIQILETFTKSTGLTANIVDVNGKSIFSAEEAQKNCSFCQLIWKLENEKGIFRCNDAYARAGKQAAIFHEPYIFRCPGGLIEWAAPLIVDDEHLGSIICGQVLMWEPEEFFWIELENMNRMLTDNFEPLYQAAKELQVVSGEKVQGAAALLNIVANHIVRTAWEKKRQKKEMELQQALLKEEMETRQRLEEKLNSQSINFFLEKERIFKGKLQLGDYKESLNLFKLMLGDIYQDECEKIHTLKSRVFELIVIISRVAVEAGMDLEKAAGLNGVFLQKLETCDAIEMINDAALKLFETYFNSISKSSVSKNRMLIESIKGFIRNHFRENLTLEMIAESVYRSVYYISRIFKESEKITIMDYVVSVKMDEAKKMLLNPKYKIDEIAEYLGYTDQSYFTKVFKKHEGMTPSQFRRE